MIRPINPLHKKQRISCDRYLNFLNNDMYHDDEDLHMCISCHATIAGLENYISHRNAGPCKSQHSVKRTEAPIPVLSPLEISKSERIRPISSTTSAPSGENLNFLNADFFFSSLELQSRRKDGVFEEVMGIEEVLDEEYEVRDNGGQRTVYSSGGKWGYDDYTTEREMWGGGGKGSEGLDGGDFHEDEVDLHSKSETFKEKNKKKKDKNLSICETEENAATFDESLGTDVDYVMRNASPAKSGMISPPIKVARPPEDVCLSDATKENVIGEFGISLDSCNLVMDSLDNKEVEKRYKNATVPPSGHTRGKWIPGSASEGIRKSGNAVEYFCKPCNKNIRNRRSYEAHLSTSCHLKKLMKNSGGQDCITTSEGPRLRSRRILLSKPDPKSEKTKDNKLVKEDSKSQEDKPKNSVIDSQCYLMNSLGVKRKLSEDQVSEDCLESVPLSSSMDLLEKADNIIQTSDDKNNLDNSSGKPNPKKRKYNRKILKRAPKSGSAYDGNEQVIDNNMMKKRTYPEVCEEGSAYDGNEQVIDNNMMKKRTDPEVCEETLPIVNNLDPSVETSSLNLRECNKSTTVTRDAGIDLPSKKSDNVSLIDIVSSRYPVVNLGYRCDSDEFQQEREKLKGLVNTTHCNSPHQSSDKSLQDEMLFGLELMRTESNISGGLVIRNSEVKEYSLKEIDHQTPEKLDEMNGEKNDSNFRLSEKDASCHVVSDVNSYGEAINEDVSESSIKSREDELVIQSDVRLLSNDSTDHTVTSKSPIPHIHAKSVNINDVVSARKEVVSNLSVKTSIATQAAIEEALQPENSENSSENLNESNSSSGLQNSNDTSKNEKINRPINEIEYYVVIKSSFDDKFKDSQIILKNAEPSVNEVSPKNIQVPYSDALTGSNVAENAENQSSKNIVMVVNNVEKRSEGNLESQSLTVNNEIRSLEDLRRQELNERSLYVSFIGSQEQKSNIDKNTNTELEQGTTNVFNYIENPTQIFQGIGRNELNENFLCGKKNYGLKINSYDRKGKEVNLVLDKSGHVGSFSFEQKIPGNTQFPGLVNKFSLPVASNLSQTLNFSIQVGADLDMNSQLLKAYQNAVSESMVKASENQHKMESKSSNKGEKNSVPNKRYRPLLPKLSIQECFLKLGTEDNNFSPNTSLSFKPIEGIPAEIPLIVSNDVTANLCSSPLGLTVGVPSVSTCTNSTPSGVIDRNVEDISSGLQENSNTGVSPDKVSKDLETVNSDEKQNVRFPIEIHRVENKELSEDPNSRGEEIAGTDPVKYVCGLCGYQSRRFWCVGRHMAQHLPRTKQYHCEICDMQFFSLDNLKQHSRRHEPKKWNCNIPDCHQTFATKNEWVQHVLGRHSTDRIHKCTSCDYSGKTSLALQRHMKKHRETDRSVECRVCFKIMKKDCLERHMKTHDNEGCYFCPHCDFKANYLTNLRKHIKQSDSHPGKKLYSCPFCVDGMGKDNGTCHLNEQSGVFKANSVYDMLGHINSKHPENQDFSFKYHNAGELMRRLLTFLGIYNPRREVFEKNRREDSPEEYSSVENSNERLHEGEEEMDLEGDAASHPAIRNGCPTQTSVAVISQKSGSSKDLQLAKKVCKSAGERRVQIRTDMISDEMQCNIEVQPKVNCINSTKNHAVDQLQVLNADMEMRPLVKERNSEYITSQGIGILNPTIHSSIPSIAPQERALMGDDVESSPPQAISSAKASEACFSDVEKEPQICCISNVFTMAEPEVVAELSSGEVQILGDTISCSDNVETSSVTFTGNDGNLECISVKKEAEVEVIDVEEDEVSSRNREAVHKDKVRPLPRILGNIGAAQKKTSCPLIASAQSINMRCNVISDSHDLSEKKTDSCTKQKRKVPRWSSVVEIIEKRDGVISLWPTSP